MNAHTDYIVSYLNGELSADQLAAFEEKLHISSEFRKEVNDLRYIWELSSELRLHKKINVHKNWAEISQRITAHKRRRKFVRYMQRAAAVLLPVLLITSIALGYHINQLTGESIERVQVRSVPGTVSRITLPDGSIAWLNAGSVLSYPRSFSGNYRQVSLEGEAYFQVVSDKNHRFDVVLPHQLVVSAYGTEFNINAYPDNPRIETTLVQGAIEVQTKSGAEAYQLTPSQQLSYSLKDDMVKIKSVNVSLSTSWKDGKIVFRRSGMEEVVERLSRKFNVQIILQGEELYDYEYSATFTNETLPEILHLLEQSTPIECQIIEPEQSKDYTFSQRTVIIKTIQNK